MRATAALNVAINHQVGPTPIAKSGCQITGQLVVIYIKVPFTW
jgi:hypothetical protein